jgi:hypothetical protein
MNIISPEVSAKVQPYLIAEENLVWAGKPSPGILFHTEDWFMIPISMLWGGYSIYMEMDALGFWGGGNSKNGVPSFLMVLFWIPFVLIGQYLIWGRFIYDAWRKRRTYYAITNRRVLVLQEGRKRRICWLYYNEIPTIELEGSTRGTIWFGSKYPIISPEGSDQKTRGDNRFRVGNMPIFSDIDNLDLISNLVLELRKKNSSSAAATRKEIGDADKKT